jgi:NADPH:quinone reductase-like Zn-dependent oxidoreductase
MKAIVCPAYGPPTVLQLREVATPTPSAKDVRIRIHATTATTAGLAMLTGDPFIARLATGLRRPKVPIPGTELAGEIDAVGGAVTRFRVGDQVVAASDLRFGAHAEYIVLPEDAAIAPKPVTMTYAEAVALCEGGLTALPFLRAAAKVQPGQAVLINGAAGAVGTAAVQLATYFGAVVTGVCGPAHLELVKSLGADTVVDYTRQDFTTTGQTYDIIFDTVGKSSFTRCRGALKPGGVYLTTVPTLAILPQMLWTSRFGNKRAIFAATGLRPTSAKTKDLLVLKELAEAGQLRAVIDRRYPLAQAVEAYQHVATGHKQGHVVLTLDQPGQRHPVTPRPRDLARTEAPREP